MFLLRVSWQWRLRAARSPMTPDVELTHVGELCSFDAFLHRYQLTDPALTQLAVIVRGGYRPAGAGATSRGLACRVARPFSHIRR